MKCNHDFMNKLKKKNAKKMSLKTRSKIAEGGGQETAYPREQEGYGSCNHYDFSSNFNGTWRVFC